MVDQLFQSLFEWCVEALPRPWNWIAGFAVIASLVGLVVWFFGGL